MGREKTSETAFLVIRRPAEEELTPAYQAVTTVLRSPNAMIAIVIPRMVNIVRRRCLKAFLIMILRMNIAQHTLVQITDSMSLLGCPWIMGNHDDGFAEIPVQAI